MKQSRFLCEESSSFKTDYHKAMIVPMILRKFAYFSNYVKTGESRKKYVPNAMYLGFRMETKLNNYFLYTIH